MRGQNKPKKQLVTELEELRHPIIEEGQSEGTRIQTEEALRESQNYYRTLIQNLPPKIFLKDKNSVYLSCNENFSRDLKMRPAEITGKTDYDFYPKKLAEKFRADDKRIMETGKTGDTEEKYIQDGMEVIIHKVKTPVKDEEGKIIGVLGIFWDITERKHADDELKKYREDLEELVEERTAELRNANEQLQQEITERRLAEKALRKSEERYRTLFEESRDPIFITSREGEILDTNQSMLDLFGYSREEIIGFNARDTYVHPEDRLKFQQVIERQGFVRDYEIKLRKKDRAEIECLLTGIVRKTADGNIAGYQGIIRDITERKRVEEALRLANAYNRSLIEASLDPLVTIGPDGKVTDVNTATEKITGYSRKELIGTDFMDYFSEPEKAKSGYRQVFQVGFVQDYALEIQHKNGHLTPVLYNASVYQDEAGQVIGVFAAARDVTKRKKAEEQLSKLFRAVEQSPATVMITDTDANIEYVNPKFTQLTGYSLEEVIGKNPRILKSGETPPEEYKLLWETITSGREWRGEFHNKKKNGELYWESASISSIKNPEGLITHFVAVKEDISERKRVEEERETLQEQLRQSQKMEAIGQLAGGVAHDFNNLLTVIKGYTQLSLNETKESDPLRGNIEEIKKASDRAADLTRQLLAFSRRQIMEVKILDLNDLLQNLDKMLRRIIGEDIELVTLLGEDLGTVKADPGQLEQVVINLAVNAKDAMSKGGKLTIETANVELDKAYAQAHVAVTPGPYVMIAVSDTGTGMPPEVRDRVFEPFFTTKGKSKGTGLGLSTVYGIVKQSGGNIWVYSEPGRGTTLKIYLPRVDEPAEKLKAQAIGEELPQGSGTILIVEDDKEVRKLALRILTRQGYTVLDGSYGAEAFNACRQHRGPIHLLVTDVVMPGMDGCALAESLSQLHPEMKVLYMSGYTEDAIIHHGVMEKAMNFIQKPFTVSGLINKVREVLDK